MTDGEGGLIVRLKYEVLAKVQLANLRFPFDERHCRAPSSRATTFEHHTAWYAQTPEGPDSLMVVPDALRTTKVPNPEVRDQ
jgi:hypothetical protein